MSLYSITTEYQRLIDAIECGEIPDEAVKDTLEAVNGEWEERADAVLSAIKNLLGDAEKIKKEVDILVQRRDAKIKAAERLKGYIEQSMIAVSRTAYESARHKVTFRSSSALKVTDEKALIRYAKKKHPELITKEITFKYSKSDFKKLLELEKIPGVEIETRKNIQIK